MNSKNLKEFFFIVTLITLFIGFLYVFSPYLGVIFIALILVEIFYPWYRFLENKLKHESIASFLAGMSVILTIVIPIAIVLIIVVFQATSLIDKVTEYRQDHDITSEYKNLINEVNILIEKFSSNPNDQITSDEVRDFAFNASQDFLNAIVNGIKSTATSSLTIITKAFMFIIALFSLFPLRNKLHQGIKELSPLEDNLDNLFITNFVETTRAVIKGTFIVAIVYGIIGGILFWILGIEAPVFWGMMMTAVSIIPIGSGLIWIPASIYLLVSGEVAKGIFLFVSGLIMTNSFDNVLKGRLAQSKSNVHPLLLSFAILGGLEVFGVLGFLYGPIIAVLFMSLLRVYKEKYK